MTKTYSAMPCSIGEAAKLIREGKLTSTRLTRACFDFVDQVQPIMNIFISQLRDEAMASAVERDVELAAGRDRGPLHGIPILVKDIFEVAGTKTTVGAEIFAERKSVEDATVIHRLREAGAVFLGKTNMNEFAAGMSGVNTYFGDCHNPWSIERSPGGSSSGNGAALAAGIGFGGASTDTGGSIRIPASWCGIAGMRPTPGIVSLHGLFPRSFSLDCAGPHARCVMDLALLLDAMGGFDPKDEHSTRIQAEKSYSDGIGVGVKGLKIAIITNYTYRNVDAPIAAAIEKAVSEFSKLGAQIVEVDLSFLASNFDYDRLYTNILLYEFNQILGDQFRNAKDPQAMYGRVVSSNIEMGAKVLRQDYEKTLEARASTIADVRKVFADVDALITPASPITALPLTSPAREFDRARQFAIPFSYVALPSIAIPCGFDPDGLPIGLQIVSDCFAEAKILRIGYAFERATNHHQKHPPLFLGRID